MEAPTLCGRTRQREREVESERVTWFDEWKSRVGLACCLVEAVKARTKVQSKEEDGRG